MGEPDHLELLQRVQLERRTMATTGPRTARGDLDFERVSLPHAEGDVLRDALLEEKARSVIEIGLGYGSSALAVAEALVAGGTDDAAHLIIDPYQDRFGEAGWDALLAAGLAGVCTLRRERSQLVLPTLVADGLEMDAAFVDGSHRFDNVFVDLYFLREIVHPGGLVILDDCEWPSVAAAARYFEVNASWKRAALPPETRLRAYRLPDPPVEPGFESFVPFT